MSINEINIYTVAAVLAIIILLIVALSCSIAVDRAKRKMVEALTAATEYGSTVKLGARHYRVIPASDLAALIKKAEMNNPVWDYHTTNGKAR